MDEIASADEGAGFLGVAEETDEGRRLYDGDIDDLGYVMNVSRVWAHEPALLDGVRQLVDVAAAAADSRSAGEAC